MFLGNCVEDRLENIKEELSETWPNMQLDINPNGVALVLISQWCVA
jgi:hypothetical protein